MSTTRARNGGLAALALVGALATAVPATAAQAGTIPRPTPTPTPTTTASPTTGPIDCPRALPVASAVDGLKGIGWTVSKGTAPERFDATVLGVIKDGSGPGLDVVLAELASPALTRVGGVWSGMSGSPVYTADGRLIGAVAYTFTRGSSMVAGLTPAVDMLPMVGVAASPTRRAVTPKAVVPLDKASAARVAREGVSAAAIGSGLRRLDMPLWVPGSGRFSQRIAESLRKDGVDARTGGSSGSTGAASPSEIHAGGNIAAAASTGAVTMAAVGTTTAVCNGRVVGFGHPYDSTGPSSLAITTASAVTVFPDALGSAFKAANIGGVVGALDQDSITGIAGALGVAPAHAIPVTTVLTTPLGNSTKLVSTLHEPQAAGMVTALQTYYALAKALGGEGAPGSASTSLTVVGKRADGRMFSLTRSDQVSASALSQGLPGTVGDSVWDVVGLITGQEFEDVTITKVIVGVKYAPAPTALAFTGGSVQKGSTWVKLTSKPVKVLPGAQSLRLSFLPARGTSAGPVQVTVPFTVPESWAGSSAELTVSGGPAGAADVDTSELSSFDELLRALSALPKSNVVRVTVADFSDSKPITASVTLPAPVSSFSLSASLQVEGGPEPKG